MRFKRAVFVFSCLAIVFLLGPRPAFAAPVAQQPTPEAIAASNESCLACHNNPAAAYSLPSGETLELYVDPAEYAASVHGSKGYACVQCHTTLTGYPHPQLVAQTRRDVSTQLYTACKTCHTRNYESLLDSVHGQRLESGNTNAAVCSDCHGAHDTQKPGQPRTDIPATCAKCHSEIYKLYQSSVHGAALTTGNPDVPTCTDCHGVHTITPASTGAFRLRSPDVCARCHTDPALMNKYGERTDVLDTYLSDFHGTTVTLFNKTAPGQQTNKPVCIDCHSVHDIKLVTDPNSSVIKRNILITCQKCHPDATENFPAAWLSHYSPSADRNPLVYYVNVFYKFFIPTVIGGMLVFVLSDAGRKVIGRRKKEKGKRKKEEGDRKQEEGSRKQEAE